MISYRSIEELVKAAAAANTTIGNVVIRQQALEQRRSTDELYQQMADNLQVMRESIEFGLRPGHRSPSGLSGGDAHKLLEAVEQNRTVGGIFLGKALVRALAVAEVNASMGRIVAAPTAGSCGILPAALFTAMEERNISEEQVILGLFTAGGIGTVISKQATISGAQGGCQAECGSAAAMAAAAIVEMVQGSPPAGRSCLCQSGKKRLGPGM